MAEIEHFYDPEVTAHPRIEVCCPDLERHF